MALYINRTREMLGQVEELSENGPVMLDKQVVSSLPIYIAKGLNLGNGNNAALMPPHDEDKPYLRHTTFGLRKLAQLLDLADASYKVVYTIRGEFIESNRNYYNALTRMAKDGRIVVANSSVGGAHRIMNGEKKIFEKKPISLAWIRRAFDEIMTSHYNWRIGFLKAASRDDFNPTNADAYNDIRSMLEKAVNEMPPYMTADGENLQYDVDFGCLASAFASRADGNGLTPLVSSESIENLLFWAADNPINPSKAGKSSFPHRLRVSLRSKQISEKDSPIRSVGDYLFSLDPVSISPASDELA